MQFWDPDETPFVDQFRPQSGADMYQASIAAIVMPPACMVLEGWVQIKAACSKALCCTLVLPIPSHDRCAKLLIALLRSDALAVADDLHRRGRSLVNAIPGHQGPDDARYFVRQCHAHQHRGLLVGFGPDMCIPLPGDIELTKVQEGYVDTVA